MQNAAILGTGEALPAERVTTARLCAEFGVDPQWEERSGVHTRHRLSGTETALDMGVAAARMALADAGLTAGDVDLVVNASGSQLQPIPDGSALLAGGLGLSGTETFSVHATCLSFLMAMREVATLVATGQARNALVISTEAGSAGINPAEPESAVLMGDGAAAVVVGPAGSEGQGMTGFCFRTYPEGADLTQIRGGGSLCPPPRYPENPAAFAFSMQGLQVLRIGHRVARSFVEQMRPGLSRGPAGFARIIPHQASRSGLDLMRRFGWGPVMESTLGELGNLIAASMPITLHRAVRAGRVRRGDELLFIGTGAGLSLGALSWRF